MTQSPRPHTQKVGHPPAVERRERGIEEVDLAQAAIERQPFVDGELKRGQPEDVPPVVEVRGGGPGVMVRR